MSAGEKRFAVIASGAGCAVINSLVHIKNQSIHNISPEKRRVKYEFHV